MKDPVSSQADALTDELAAAFSMVPKPESVQTSTISNEDADELIRHIHRYDDDVQNFHIPRLLTMAICADVAASRRNEWIRALVAFLNLDFEEFQPGIDALLKDLRRAPFSSYTATQARAIYHWLVFVRANYEWSPFRDEVDSAVEYWKNRADSGEQKEGKN